MSLIGGLEYRDWNLRTPALQKKGAVKLSGAPSVASY